MSICPKLHNLIDVAFSHARKLLADRDPVFPFLVTSLPGSAFAVRVYETPFENALKAAKEVLAADPAIDCGVFGYHASDKAIDGRLGDAIVAVPYERGADKTHEYFQELRRASIWRCGELVKSPRKGEEHGTLFRPVPVPEFSPTGSNMRACACLT